MSKIHHDGVQTDVPELWLRWLTHYATPSTINTRQPQTTTYDLYFFRLTYELPITNLPDDKYFFSRSIIKTSMTNPSQGGAHRTSSKGTGWVCLWYVQGFQSQSESLQFEYALKRKARQHGYSSQARRRAVHILFNEEHWKNLPLETVTMDQTKWALRIFR